MAYMVNPRRNSVRLLRMALLIALTGSVGCSFPGVYKINVQQGTIVKQEDLDTLKPGMSRKQVHLVLGTPSLINTFDASDETYLYTYQKQGGEIRQQKVVVFYTEDGKYDHHIANLLEETPAY